MPGGNFVTRGAKGKGGFGSGYDSKVDDVMIIGETSKRSGTFAGSGRNDGSMQQSPSQGNPSSDLGVGYASGGGKGGIKLCGGNILGFGYNNDDNSDGVGSDYGNSRTAQPSRSPLWNRQRFIPGRVASLHEEVSLKISR